jgi:hypothetical protein
MTKFLLLSIALTMSACATFSTLTPTGAYTDINKGVWVAKTSSIFGIKFSSQEILFCEADTKSRPICVRAGGDVNATKLNEATKAADGAVK